jgi:hypothetical protein
MANRTVLRSGKVVSALFLFGLAASTGGGVTSSPSSTEIDSPGFATGPGVFRALSVGALAGVRARRFCKISSGLRPATSLSMANCGMSEGQKPKFLLKVARRMAFCASAGAIESLARLFHSLAQGEAAMVVIGGDIVKLRKRSRQWQGRCDNRKASSER